MPDGGNFAQAAQEYRDGRDRKQPMPRRDPATFDHPPLSPHADTYTRLGIPTPEEEARAKAMENREPTEFVWRDPASIPPRPWLYGHHLIRKQVSVTGKRHGVTLRGEA